MPDLSQLSLDLNSLKAAYAGGLSVADVMQEVWQRAEQYPDHNIWIYRLSLQQIQPFIDALPQAPSEDLPLYGVPFVIKDNIDLAGFPTTAACAEYTYTAQTSATVVQQLLDAGAIPLGKSNLDQFATGLVGVRSPYGACKNSFDPDYISGGSSSGSAVAVALGLASFSLGTDTAGSGRVPAAFNNIIGLKPSRGRLSTSGVVPACRSLDCVSIFALSCGDAETVLSSAEGFDDSDPFSRALPTPLPAQSSQPRRIGVPRQEQLAFFANTEAEALYANACAQVGENVEIVEIDYQPLLDTAALLYHGPWVSERYAAIEDFIARDADKLFPTTAQIILPGKDITAVDAFKAQYALQQLQQQVACLWQQIDMLLLPTTGSIFSQAEVAAEPVQRNTDLGYYTNFVNLLDLSALAIPAGFQANGLPLGVTLMAPAWHEEALLGYASHFQRRLVQRVGAPGLPPLSESSAEPTDTAYLPLVVCGAHLSGMALNHQLTERGAWLLEATLSADDYRLYALQNGPLPRPAMVHDHHYGRAIEVEVWALPWARVGDFLDGIAAPLGLGQVKLADGRLETGFICAYGELHDAFEITGFGGWRGFMAAIAAEKAKQ